MSVLHTLTLLAFQLAGVLLTLYGGFILISILLYLRHRSRHDWLDGARLPDESPPVTVQVPIFNEPHVAERIVSAVAALDYPRQCLQIQVLDDSTDRTAPLLRALTAQLRRTQGLNIEYRHRQDRRGYKAGALAAGLEHASGEFIAIFDADFLPAPDWLRRTLPALTAHPKLAFVQTRWAHLNREQNPITAAQALALDGHFVVEQQARSASGFMQNFNGSGGLWRRDAILAAGGWTDDTVTEDLDLSYRAQLRGWGGAYLNSVEAPAELPPLLSSYKRQQKRWAKGSAQTLRKLGGEILSSSLPLPRRLYALLHLGAYANLLPLLALLTLTLPLALLPNPAIPWPAVGSVSSLISVAPFVMYGLAQHNLGGRAGLRRLWALPVLALISLGLSPTVGGAVLDGFRRTGGTFERTPKQGNEARHTAMPEGVNWRELLPEGLTGLYAFLTLVVIIWQNQWHLLPLPALYTLGCGLVFWQGLSEQLHTAVRSARPEPLARPVRSQISG